MAAAEPRTASWPLLTRENSRHANGHGHDGRGHESGEAVEKSVRLMRPGKEGDVDQCPQKRRGTLDALTTDVVDVPVAIGQVAGVGVDDLGVIGADRGL